MGNALKNQGKLEGAIGAYKNALSLKNNFAEAYGNMAMVLKNLIFTKPNPKLLRVITSILDHKTDVRPKDISKAAISLLKFEPPLVEVLRIHSKGELNQSLQEAILNLSRLPLLLRLMSVCPLADLELEAILVKIRSGLLFSISDIVGSPETLRFQSALALQCFTNEYVYKHTVDEVEAVQLLAAVVGQKIANGQQPSPTSILCLATYRALHEYEWCDLLTITSDTEKVFTRQVLEPEQEDRLKPGIPTLEGITNKVSTKVKEQYEENPYPRWVSLALSLRHIPISLRVKEASLKLFDPAINRIESPNILVAGCGTGQHSIGTASTFQSSKIFAIDLSLSSLAYAKRKTDEFGIENIKYMQADILDLGKLDRKFDIIESSGVLHHMANPLAGWRI